MPDEAEATASECRGGIRGCMDCKKALCAGVVEHFAPLRERRQVFVDNPKRLDDIIHDGCQRASVAAHETIQEIHSIMGIG